MYGLNRVGVGQYVMRDPNYVASRAAEKKWYAVIKSDTGDTVTGPFGTLYETARYLRMAKHIGVFHPENDGDAA